MVSQEDDSTTMQQQQKALGELKTLLTSARQAESSVIVSGPEEDVYLNLYLKNKKCDVQAAFKKLMRRRAFERIFRQFTITDVMVRSLQSGKFNIAGRDFQDRPVLIVSTRYHCPEKESRYEEQKCFIMIMEFLQRYYCRSNVSNRPYNTSHKCVFVIDRSGATLWGNTDLNFEREMATLLSKYYPEQIDEILIVNQHWSIASASQPFLQIPPPSMRGRIKTLPLGDLWQHVHVDVLPPSLGGHNVSSESAPKDLCDRVLRHWYALCERVHRGESIWFRPIGDSNGDFYYSSSPSSLGNTTSPRIMYLGREKDSVPPGTTTNAVSHPSKLCDLSLSGRPESWIQASLALHDASRAGANSLWADVSRNQIGSAYVVSAERNNASSPTFKDATQDFDDLESNMRTALDEPYTEYSAETDADLESVDGNTSNTYSPTLSSENNANHSVGNRVPGERAYRKIPSPLDAVPSKDSTAASVAWWRVRVDDAERRVRDLEHQLNMIRSGVAPLNNIQGGNNSLTPRRMRGSQSTSSRPLPLIPATEGPPLRTTAPRSIAYGPVLPVGGSGMDAAVPSEISRVLRAFHEQSNVLVNEVIHEMCSSGELSTKAMLESVYRSFGRIIQARNQIAAVQNMPFVFERQDDANDLEDNLVKQRAKCCCLQ